jgi:pyroglutamyl-peptidase
MSLLVAAFEPFDGRRKNRSQRAARHLREDTNVEVVTLPVSFARLPAAIDELLRRRPTALLLVGESREARGLRVERLALNLIDARIADNDGEQPRQREVQPGGALALPVSCDVAALVSAIARADVPVAASAHAGTFCCNAALYLALAHPQACRTVFVHVPAKRARLRGRDAARGLRAVLAAMLTHTI